jgi:hypothetical protein
VDKNVEFFAAACKKIQDFPLAKSYSHLLRGANPYLSIDLNQKPDLAHRLAAAAASRQNFRGFAQIQVKDL